MSPPMTHTPDPLRVKARRSPRTRQSVITLGGQRRSRQSVVGLDGGYWARQPVVVPAGGLSGLGSAVGHVYFEPDVVGDSYTNAHTPMIRPRRHCNVKLGLGWRAFAGRIDSSEGSVFLDASENGGGVFFLAAVQRVKQDTDRALDVYDARVCSAFLPCPPEPAAPSSKACGMGRGEAGRVRCEERACGVGGVG
jgi:hypothetical protein